MSNKHTCSREGRLIPRLVPPPSFFAVPFRTKMDGSDVLQQISNLTSTEPSNEREVRYTITYIVRDAGKRCCSRESVVSFVGLFSARGLQVCSCAKVLRAGGALRFNLVRYVLIDRRSSQPREGVVGGLRPGRVPKLCGTTAVPIIFCQLTPCSTKGVQEGRSMPRF